MERVREQVIAEEHARFVVPAGVHRGDVASRFGFVEHVVMHESGRVNHFDHGAEHAMCVVDRPGGGSGKQQQHGPQPLAAKVGDVGKDIGDVRILAFELLSKDLLDLPQVVADEPFDSRRQARQIPAAHLRCTSKLLTRVVRPAAVNAERGRSCRPSSRLIQSGRS